MKAEALPALAIARAPLEAKNGLSEAVARTPHRRERDTSPKLQPSYRSFVPELLLVNPINQPLSLFNYGDQQEGHETRRPEYGWQPTRRNDRLSAWLIVRCHAVVPYTEAEKDKDSSADFNSEYANQRYIHTQLLLSCWAQAQ